jgi:hypothetical protein
MPNGTPNPLAAPLNTLKQINAQAVQTVNSLNTGLSTTLNQGLDALIAGAPPPIPGMPGGQVAGGLPTPSGLLPSNLKQALSGVENMLIPPGLTKPSALVTPATTTPTPAAPAAPETHIPEVSTAMATTGRRRITEIGGF